MQPLTIITSKNVRFKCTDEEKKSFYEVKRVVTHYTLLAYLGFNNKCEINMDARYFQLGVVISLEARPITFYSRRLTDPQKTYTVT